MRPSSDGPEAPAREGLSSTGVFAVGLVLAAPLLVPGRDPLALLTWLTLLAPGVGACCSKGAGPGRLGPIVIVGFLAVLCWLALPRPSAQTMGSTFSALCGLGLAGAACGALGGPGQRGAGAAPLLLMMGALLVILAPAGGLLREQPWSPGVGAFLLDLSPLTLTAESAGVDWMRHPFVYEAVGSASIGPELRSPWGGLAGPLCFVVGCILLFTVRVTVRSNPGLKGPPIHR